jgi:hypothetical protein
MTNSRYVSPIVRSTLYADLPATDKNVLVHISKFCNEDLECWPSQETLVKHTGLAIRAVRNAINSEILTLQRHGNQYTGSSKYRLDLDKLNQLYG